jgi:dTDP-4-dehydrorhamnose reductase
MITITHNIEVIVNCIALSDTRYCEDPANFDEVLAINGTLPKYLSRYCAENNIRFIQISTGCLYDESHRPCREDDHVVAHCNYVVSKWVGELGCDIERDIIIRPRLLFGDYPPEKGKRNNLLYKIANFTTFVDAFNTVTYIGDVVRAAEELILVDESGVFNVGCPEPITIYQIATDLMKIKGVRMTPEELRKSADLYLVNNVMDMSKIQQYIEMSPASEIIPECHRALKYD